VTDNKAWGKEKERGKKGGGGGVVVK